MLQKARISNTKHDSSSSCQPKLEKEGEDIMRPPSSSSSSEEENDNADIKPQIFNQNIIGSENIYGKKRRHETEGKRQITRSHTSYTSSTYGGVNSFRSRKGIGFQTHCGHLKSPEKRSRSSSEERHSGRALQTNKRRTAIFDGHTKKKNSQAVYGKGNQLSSRSMASSQPRSSQTSSQPSPRKRLKSINIPISDSETSDGENTTVFKPPCSEFLGLLGLDIPEENKSPVVDISDSISVASNVAFNSEINCKRLNNQTPIRNNQRSKNFKLPQKFNQTPPASFSEPSSLFKDVAQVEENKSCQSSPNRLFKSYGGFDSGDDLLLTPPEANSSNSDQYHGGQDIEEQYLSPTTFLARCPMCNEPISSDELRNHGSMNIRQQEQFCLAHRKKSAKKQWEAKRYPVIDWDKLDGRISKHHIYIQNLINGANSYYRNILKAKIDQGIDRNQRAMASNPIPGYYGPRGLRIILENIFRAFTPLLKKRIVQDRLIAARGYTPYVQSVLVPEMATLLIQEDLLITLPEARDVMAESAAIGELLQEEVRDLEVHDDILDDSFDD